jgi:hypothetical protein
LNGPVTYAALDVALGLKPPPIRVVRKQVRSERNTK